MPIWRSLYYPDEVAAFTESVLGLKTRRKRLEAEKLISGVEIKLRSIDGSNTLNNTRFRDPRFSDEKTRDKLRQRIVQELITKQRLQKDDDITLGKGGAKPPCGVRSQGLLFYIIGAPASGKSSIASRIADKFGCYILDSDYAKRKIPEYGNEHGANLVHEESDMLISSYAPKNLLSYCVKNNHNMVISKIGAKIETVCGFADKMGRLGYQVYLISIDLDRIKATQRAYYRFVETKRYVPLSLVLDGYANEPTLNYFRIKQRCAELFAGFAQINTDVKRGHHYILVENTGVPELDAILVGGGKHEKAGAKSISSTGQTV